MEIGFLLREWNELQEALLSLFESLLKWSNENIARAIWHAITNDRMQRRMLLAAASALYNPGALSGKKPKPEDRKNVLHGALWDEIDWIIDRADGLGQRRDASAHSPFALLASQPIEFVARTWRGHPLAETLRGKNLLAEFRLYRERASVLRRHASAIKQYVEAIENSVFPPLPQRPPWPARPE